MQAVWDVKKSLKENYANLGLALDDKGANAQVRADEQRGELHPSIIESLPEER